MGTHVETIRKIPLVLELLRRAGSTGLSVDNLDEEIVSCGSTIGQIFSSPYNILLDMKRRGLVSIIPRQPGGSRYVLTKKGLDCAEICRGIAAQFYGLIVPESAEGEQRSLVGSKPLDEDTIFFMRQVITHEMAILEGFRGCSVWTCSIAMADLIQSLAGEYASYFAPSKIRIPSVLTRLCRTRRFSQWMLRTHDPGKGIKKYRHDTWFYQLTDEGKSWATTIRCRVGSVYGLAHSR